MNNGRQEMNVSRAPADGSTEDSPIVRPASSQDRPRLLRRSRESILDGLSENLVTVLADHGGGLSLSKVLDSLERDVLVKTLKKFNGHQHKTALFLGLKPTTLCVKLQKYGVVIRRTEVDIHYPASPFFDADGLR